MEHLNTEGLEPDVVGNNQDGHSPTLDTKLNESQEGDEQSTPNDDKEEKSAEQLKRERASAVTEAIKNHKEAQEARAENAYLKAKLKVRDDKANIVDIYDDNPEVAEKIAQELYSMSYHDMLYDIDNTSSRSSSKDPGDIDSLIDRKFQEREQKRVQKDIEGYTIDFFVENNIEPKSTAFNNILKEFREYKPKSLSQAKRLMTMIYEDYTGKSSSQPRQQVSSVSMPRSKTRSFDKGSTSVKKAALEAAKAMGLNHNEEDYK